MSDFAADEIASRRDAGLLRRLRPITTAQDTWVTVEGRRALLLCSNNYLGLANHPLLVEASAKAALDWGVGAGASRLISGSMRLHHDLEERLAALKRTEAALLFNSGYQANVGVITSLVRAGDAVFSDELNHASIIDGCRLSRAGVVVYPHRDLGALEDALQRTVARRRLIVTDSIFSMDGDSAPLVQICDLAERYDAMVMVDEAHATGVMGEHGGGLVEAMGLQDRVTIQMGTLGKALGTSGAFIAARRSMVDLLINVARSFIYTTALPPPNVAATLAALDIVQQEPERRARLQDNATALQSGLRRLGVEVGSESCHIIPILIGDAVRTMQMSERLLAAGAFVQGIRPPTVGRGNFSFTCHGDEYAYRGRHSKCTRCLWKCVAGALMRHPNPDELIAWDHTYLWHPFTQMQEWLAESPLIIAAGEGNYLIDVHGRRYLDGVSSLWCNVHGHRQPQLDAALHKQIDRIAHTTLLGLASEPSIILAKRLIDLTPPNLTRVFYSDAGATAVEIALKMAFQYAQLRGESRRSGFISLTDAYHGDTLGAMSVGYSESLHHFYQPLLFPCHKLNPPHVFRWQQGMSEEAALAAAIGEAEALFKRVGDEVCALIVEPLMQGAAGMLAQPLGYVSALRRLSREHGVLLICDEVATGFGRTGRMFAVEHDMVDPDIMCLGKGITGGYLPLAATIVAEEIFQAFLAPYQDFKTFFHGHTYTGNALACAVAIANLDVFESHGVLDGVRQRSRQLADLLLRDIAGLPHVGDVRQWGLMVGIELVVDRTTRQAYPLVDRIGVRVIKAARAQGVILRPLGNVVVLMPPLSITEAEIARLCQVTRDAIVIATSPTS